MKFRINPTLGVDICFCPRSTMVGSVVIMVGFTNTRCDWILWDRRERVGGPWDTLINDLEGLPGRRLGDTELSGVLLDGLILFIRDLVPSRIYSSSLMDFEVRRLLLLMAGLTTAFLFGPGVSVWSSRSFCNSPLLKEAFSREDLVLFLRLKLLSRFFEDFNFLSLFLCASK